MLDELGQWIQKWQVNKFQAFSSSSASHSITYFSRGSHQFCLSHYFVCHSQQFLNFSSPLSFDRSFIPHSIPPSPTHPSDIAQKTSPLLCYCRCIPSEHSHKGDIFLTISEQIQAPQTSWLWVKWWWETFPSPGHHIIVSNIQILLFIAFSFLWPNKEAIYSPSWTFRISNTLCHLASSSAWNRAVLGLRHFSRLTTTTRLGTHIQSQEEYDKESLALPSNGACTCDNINWRSITQPLVNSLMTQD